MEVYGEKPQKFTAKWWEYIWEYYKWHFACVLFIIFTMVTTLHQCATRPSYDLQIMIATQQDIAPAQADYLREEAESIVADSTGNGVNEVYVMPLTLNPDGDPQIMQVNHTKFTVELSMPESYVFILSKKYADQAVGTGFFESVGVWTGDGSEEELISLKDNEKLTALGIDTEELYLGVLKLTEERQKDELEKSRYENGVLFARHLLGLE
ncbi:MAG: hypothetical protein IKY39_00550 [Clostridia bacterium]|nr:hypothetical protein [Clostridia bacterium]